MHFPHITGWIALSQGDLVTAHTLVEQGRALWQEIGDTWREVWAIVLLGKIASRQGDFSAARTFLEKSLKQAQPLHDHWLTAFCLEGLAQIVPAQRAAAWAARLWGMAAALRERCGVPLTPIERVDDEAAITAARTQLGETAFAAAWAEGRSMTPEQALAVVH